MKTILLIAVIVCSVFARHRGHHGHHGSESAAHRQFFKNCTDVAGIKPEEARALRDVAANATLSSAQETFICCMAGPMISNQQLNTTSVQDMMNRHSCNDSNVDLSAVISSCEVNGVTLDTCKNIAPFMHCVFTKLHEKSGRSDSE